MTGWDFAAPLVLLLLPLPLLMAFLPPARHSTTGGLLVPDSLLQQRGAASGTGGRRPAAGALLWLAWAALALALAGPRLVAATPALPASGRDIMLALDLSGSMATRDFEIDGVPAARIETLKHVGGELIRRRAGDRIGLVIFAERAFAASPLSFDVEAVGRTLEEATIGLVGRSTAIGDGLGLALKRLSESSAPTKIILLLSDGSNNAGTTDPAGVAQLAREMGVKLFTIALGVTDTSTDNTDPDAVDFEALQHLAEIGGGKAFRAHTTAELDAAARAIEQLAAGEAMAPPGLVRHELWFYPAIAALVAGLARALRGRRLDRRWRAGA